MYGDLLDLVSDIFPADPSSADLSLSQVADVNAPRQHTLSTVDQKRLTQERHGAIRVGKPSELQHLARMFKLLGMHPVGACGGVSSLVRIVLICFTYRLLRSYSGGATSPRHSFPTNCI